jgi:hypothetical protein
LPQTDLTDLKTAAQTALDTCRMAFRALDAWFSYKPFVFNTKKSDLQRRLSKFDFKFESKSAD